ncbi:MAG TPA: hypothetical protein PLC15_15460 [Candidatus Obscuribacter sp.]|nr:hypothetical protein [Candidatus Obscuribacter sp.]HNB16781.1 hypothetical protein [Candidatus Obscuribacter sp.]
MSTKALMRATDPSIGTNIGKTAVIKVKFSGDERGPVDPPQKVDSSISAGYRSLMRDDTLAGRQHSRNFRNDERSESNSRLRMVSNLRQKESWLIWREFVRDLDRSFGTMLQRFSPTMWLKDGKASYR